MSARATPPIPRYPERLVLRVPLGLSQALEEAARRELTSPTEYARRALLSVLNADGIRLGVDGKIQAQGA